MRASLAAVLVSLSVAVAFGTACAPRSSKTHFDRWADQTAKRKADEALEAKEKEWLKAQVTRSGGATGGSGAAANGGAHGASGSTARSGGSSSGGSSGQQPSNYNSFGGSRTSTGTKSRVIKPDSGNKDEDEAIY